MLDISQTNSDQKKSTRVSNRHTADGYEMPDDSDGENSIPQTFHRNPLIPPTGLEPALYLPEADRSILIQNLILLTIDIV
jgi:hypothetical protein